MSHGLCVPDYVSPNKVQIYNPSWSYKSTGTWSLASKRGNTLYISGLRGIDPSTNELIPIEGLDTYNGPSTRDSPVYPRTLKAFENMRMIAESAGATVGDCLRLVMYTTPNLSSYTTDMYRFRPLVNEAQKEIWGDVPFPPRSIIEVSRLNQDDIVEVESTFAVPD